MDFGNANPCVVEGLECLLWLLVLEREVTGVVGDADVFFEDLGIEAFCLCPSMEMLEKLQGLCGVFKETEGLRLEAEMEVFSRIFRELVQQLGTGVEIGKGILTCSVEALVRGGQSGQRATERGGAQLGENRREIGGVEQALLGTPIGGEDLLLEAALVKFTVGKAVDRVNVAVRGVEPELKFVQMLAGEKLFGSAGREAKADGVSGVFALLIGDFFKQKFADFERVGLDVGESFFPRLGGMDVRAVADVASHGVLFTKLLVFTIEQKPNDIAPNESTDEEGWHDDAGGESERLSFEPMQVSEHDKSHGQPPEKQTLDQYEA